MVSSDFKAFRGIKEEDKKDILKHIEEKKLLKELLEERKKLKNIE